jgi:hypothetical protein
MVQSTAARRIRTALRYMTELLRGWMGLVVREPVT